MNGFAGSAMASHIGANIRLLCEQHGSIAEVCRSIDINRQQFNKYLAGRTIPNPITLRRLCEYFAVSEKELFLAPDAFKAAMDQSVRAAARCLPDRLVGLMRRMAAGAEDCLREGLYYVYYPWLRDPTKTLRGLLAIRRQDDILAFKRLTRIARPEHGSKYRARSKHDGVVFEQQGTIFLAAVDSQAQAGLSLMAFGRPAVGQSGIFTGLALVMTAWSEPIASRVTLEHLPAPATLRQALGRCGVVDLRSNDIDSVTRDTIATPSTETVAQLLPYSAMQRILG